MSLLVELWAHVTSNVCKMAGVGRATGTGPKQQKAPALTAAKDIEKKMAETTE